MSLSTTLLGTLKRYLKVKGMTYRMLADEMQLSEAAVKRMFSKKAFSLVRLEQVCSVLDIDFYDLVVMDRQRNRSAAESLTREQEEVLERNEKLGFLLYFLSNGWSVEQVTEEFEYSEPEVVRMLGTLEELGLLEVHPNNRIKLLASANAYWQVAGSIRKEIHQAFVTDFLEDSFNHPSARMIFSPGQFSGASLKIIQRKVDNLIKEYNQLAEMDSALPIKGRYSTGMLIGFRPWVFTRIANLRRRGKR